MVVQDKAIYDKALEDKVRWLACWKGSVELEPLAGGFTNTNFLVHDRQACYVVRAGPLYDPQMERLKA